MEILVQSALSDMFEPGGPPDAAELSMASAAYAVLRGTRRATRLDLLLSTVVEILNVGGLTTSEVHQAVSDAWPGSDITLADVEEALEVAASAGQQLVVRGEGLEGPVWQLAEAGRLEVETTQGWIEGFKHRLMIALRERARTDFRDCTEAEATSWAERLIGALGIGIRAAEAGYLGEVDLLNEHAIRITAADDERMQRVLTAGVAEECAEFLQAAVIAALDPTDPFGDEAVTVISTSCVLHGHLARIDEAALQAQLGPLAGQKIVLDTPILVSLASASSVGEPLVQMVRAAVSAGVEVIVPDYYLQELQELLDAVETSGEVARLEPMMQDPEQRAAYIALSDRDSLIATYAQLRHDGTVAGWPDFRTHVAALAGQLRAIGATIRPHGNADPEQVEACRLALAVTIEESGAGRRPAAVERDANTMSMALRHRRRFAREHTDIAWPGFFVVTHDRRLTPAFRRVDPKLGRVPLAVLPTLFTLMLARVRPVPEVASLADAASRLLVREVANRVAVRYPPEAAAELAHVLGGAGGSTDVRVAQFPTVASVLEATVSADPDQVVAEVQRRRARRARMAVRHANVLQESDQLVSDAHLAAAEQRARVAQDERDHQRDEVARKECEIADLRRQLESQPTSEDIAKLRRRNVGRAVVITATLAVAVWMSVSVAWPWGLAAAVGAGMFGLQTAQWGRDASIRLRESIVGIVADSAGLLVSLSGWLFHR
ncbi:MAG TPA: hypothetical protein VGH43_03920 [Jatrophihabitans sp.]